MRATILVVFLFCQSPPQKKKQHHVIFTVSPLHQPSPNSTPAMLNLFAVSWSNTLMSPMLPRSTALSLALILSACGGGGDQSGSTSSTGSSSSGGGTSTADTTDYSVAANWVCRPGSDVPCTTGLDAEVLNADGTTEAQPFTAATDPLIDCFYVYPTVSQEQTDYADLTDSPEIQAVTREQVGRLSSRCRVFAPIYRQETSYGLNHGAPPSDDPMLDVQGAWTYYLQNYNQGRGVVLVGHSQGTILLQQLIANSIDGTGTQALLVSAFLAGDPSLGVPSGRRGWGYIRAHSDLCRRRSDRMRVRMGQLPGWRQFCSALVRRREKRWSC